MSISIINIKTMYVQLSNDAPSRVTICHACHFLAEQKANSTTSPTYDKFAQCLILREPTPSNRFFRPMQ